FIINSTMSSGASLSMPRLAGLIASVGRACHFDRTVICTSTLNLNYNSTIPRTPRLRARTTSPVEAYLTHLTVERRLAANSVESYARDLVLLGRFAAGRRTAIDALTRHDLED